VTGGGRSRRGSGCRGAGRGARVARYAARRRSAATCRCGTKAVAGAPTVAGGRSDVGTARAGDPRGAATLCTLQRHRRATYGPPYRATPRASSSTPDPEPAATGPRPSPRPPPRQLAPRTPGSRPSTRLSADQSRGSAPRRDIAGTVRGDEGALIDVPPMSTAITAEVVGSTGVTAR